MAKHGWTNVEVREADAARLSHGHEEFDAAVALSSLSAMPDVGAAVRLAHDALRPGGRLFVFDVPLVPSGRLRTRTMPPVPGRTRLTFQLATRQPGGDE